MAQSTANSNTKYIDYLTEDPPIPGQLWVCISFLSPEGIKNCSLRGLKIRGVFGTRQEADKKAEELQKMDSDFHVFVGEMGKWLPWDPEPSDIKDNRYIEKELNDLMHGYQENLEKASQVQEDRKKSMIKEAAKEQAKEQAKQATKNAKAGSEPSKQEESNLDKTKDRLRKRLDAKRQQDGILDSNVKEEVNQSGKIKLSEKEQELKYIEEVVKKDEELAKSERERINETKKQINETTQNLETIDSKLAKIQELYEKINKKK